MDKTLTSSLAATLTGLSITAAAFFTNMIKSKSDALGELQLRIGKIKNSIELEDDPVRKRDFERELSYVDREYKEVAAIVRSGPLIIKYLLLAFFLFVVFLVESVTLDPAVETAISTSTGVSSQEIISGGLDHFTLLSADVGLSMGPLAIGITLLCLSARRMYKLITALSKVR
jgi:hypothetical protein